VKKITIGIMIFAIATFMVIGLTACNNTTGEGHAIKLVKDSVTAVPYGTVCTWDYKTGKLEGGIAVLVNDNGAYWVKNVIVYAANGFAKTWSPSLDYSPAGIDFDTVRDSVKN